MSYKLNWDLREIEENGSNQLYIAGLNVSEARDENKKEAPTKRIRIELYIAKIKTW